MAQKREDVTSRSPNPSTLLNFTRSVSDPRPKTLLSDVIRGGGSSHWPFFRPALEDDVYIWKRYSAPCRTWLCCRCEMAVTKDPSPSYCGRQEYYLFHERPSTIGEIGRRSPDKEHLFSRMALTTLSQGTQARPGFYIVVDEPQRNFFTACDTIKGRVVLKSSGNVDIGKVSIQFWGRSKTKLYRRDMNNQKHTHRSSACLFWKILCLYNGHYTHKDPSYEWPFEFTFPSTAQRDHHGDQWMEQGQYFKDRLQNESIPLPPTFSHRGDGPGGWNHDFDCLVEYKLEAALHGPNSGLSRFEHEIFLPFAGSSKIDPAALLMALSSRGQVFDVRNYSLDPKYQGRSLSLKEKSKSFVGFSSVPNAQFSVEWYCPLRVRLGEPVSMYFELTHRKQSSTVPTPPAVSLQRGSVTVIAKTHVRSSPGVLARTHHNSTEKIIGWTTVFKNCRGPFTKDTGYRKEVCMAGFPSIKICPSFSTYNICRQYELKMSCVIECVGDEFEIQHRAPVEILPGKLKDSVQDAKSMEGLVNLAKHEEARPQLPLYQAVVAGSG